MDTKIKILDELSLSSVIDNETELIPLMTEDAIFPVPIKPSIIFKIINFLKFQSIKKKDRYLKGIGL